MTKSPRFLIYIFLIAFVSGLPIISIGCSHQSVRHLKRQPWRLNKSQLLEMKYLQFQYVCTQTQKGLKVQGNAYPKDKNIPTWADWTNEIWLGAYLSDEDGKVIAKNIKILPPQKLIREKGYPFAFTLCPQSMGSSGPIYITFGYRLVLTREKMSSSEYINLNNKQESKKDIFFASESALTTF